MSGLVTAAAVKSALGAVGGFFKSVPPAVWYGLAALAALAIGVHMHGNAVKRAYSAAYAQGSKDTSQAFQRARAKADEAALKQKQDMEAHYAALASQKDREYEAQLASARDATDRYIATHSVRPASNQGGTGTATASSDNHGASIPQGLSTDPLVAVSKPDVQACTAAVSYGIAAHDWAKSLEKVQP